MLKKIVINDHFLKLLITILGDMKSRNNLSLTYMGYLQQASYAHEVADVADIYALLDRIKHLNSPLQNNLPLVFVIDYTARRYLVMSDAAKAVSSYHPQEFIESGMEKLMDVFNKEDFPVYNQKIFTANTAFLKSTPQNEHDQYVFSYNFRIRRGDKSTAHLLQKGHYITSKETGLPLYSIGTVTDITHVKTDSVMVHTIERINSVNPSAIKQVVQSNYFYPDAEDAAFTRREKTLLQYLADGLSSKQLADKLFISENTVITHKQNMLRKTNTKNTVELVAFSIRNHII